jgi:hypothetical protein
MITFKRFLNEVLVGLNESEYLVHKGIDKKSWTLRKLIKSSPEALPTHVSDLPKIILKDATVWIDHDALEAGRNIVAFIKGERVKDIEPASEGRGIGYSKARLPEPFFYLDDNSIYTGSKYAVFDGNKFTAY